MKRIIHNKRVIIPVLILAVLLLTSGIFSFFNHPQTAHAAWYSTGGTWNYRKAVTFTADAAKIPSTQTDFPALINLTTDAGLAANALDNGNDILFTSSDATTKLSHEIESFNGTTGALVAWVKVPSLATSGVIYMYYGNATATNQQNAAGVWSNGYAGVWHLNDNPALATIISSTGNYNGSAYGTWNADQSVAAKIQNGLSMVGGNYIAAAVDVGDIDAGVTTGLTFSAWFKASQTNSPARIMDGTTAGDASQGFSIFVYQNQLNFQYGTGGAARGFPFTDTTSYHHVMLTWDGSNWRPYLDGVPLTISAAAVYTNQTDYRLGALHPPSSSQGWQGIIDDSSFSSSARSASWITTEYANQNDPGSFFSLAGEENRDGIAPSNPTSITGKDSSGGSTTLTTGNYYNYPTPYFEWPVAEAAGGAHDTGNEFVSGVGGYYSYFGTSCGGGGANPQMSRGVLSDTGGGLHYSATTNVTVPDLTTNNGSYCLRIKTADNVGNVQSTVWEAFIYKYDSTAPNAPTFVAVNPAGYSAVNSFDFSWPVATDDVGGSGLAGYQYMRGGTSGDTWSATQAATTKTGIASYQTGANIFLVRSIDNTGNISASVQTTYYYSNEVPTKPTGVTATPGVSDVNSFAFSWTAPVHAVPIVDYGYVVNAVPTLTNLTWTGSNATTLAADAFATQQGVNTFYIVAKDDSGAYGIAEANYGTAAFNCTTVAPPIPLAVSISDSSNHNINLWALTISWDAGIGQDPATFAHYLVERSTNGVDFAALATTTSTAYIDATGLNNTTTYYYRIKSVDNAGSISAASSIVSKMPTGKYTSAPTIVSGPDVSAKSTSATISWVVSRPSTSSVRFGTTEGELSRNQIDLVAKTSQSILLVGLTAGTRYYYQIQSLDEFRDYSSESAYSSTYNFTTLVAPSIANVAVSNITLTTADITWETSTASNTKVYFGTSISYGAVLPEDNTSMTIRHTVRLINLANTSRYHFKIYGSDIDGNILSSDDYVFDTLAMPVISAISYQSDLSGPEPMMVITWRTNVPTSSSVEYSLLSGDQTVHKVNQSELVLEHKVLLSNLADDTEYRFYVSGSDQFGNFVRSEMQILRTSRDTKPPGISGVNIETSNVGLLADKARVIVSWKTDEPATTQVEYNRGISGDNYALMTDEDSGLITNHSVTISGLDSLVPFHLRVISKDKAGNEAKSQNSTFTTAEVQQSIMILVMRILKNVFGWLGIL